MISIFMRMRTLEKRKYFFHDVASISIDDLIELFNKGGRYDPDEIKKILNQIARCIKVDVGKLRPDILLCDVLKEDSPFDDDFLEIEAALSKNVGIDFNKIDIRYLVDLMYRFGNAKND